MNQAEAAEKIKKLLKSKGRTEAEADTAQILAAAIAAKHGIDIAAMDAQEEQKRNEITHHQAGQWASMPCEAKYAALICKRFFEVSTICVQGFMDTEYFVGTEWHLQIAGYVFNFLVKEFRWQWNKRRGRSKKRTNFIYGCYIGLHVKLQERFAREGESTALEISFAAKREAYMDKHWPNRITTKSTPKKTTGAAINNGYNAGKNIEIRPGVKAGEKNEQGALPGFAVGRLLGNG